MPMRTAAAILMLAATLLAGAAAAETRALSLVVDERLEASGFMRHLAPRFALKHGVRPEITPAPAEGIAAFARGAGADLLIGPTAALGAEPGLRPAFRSEDAAGEERFSLLLLDGGANPGPAGTFADWLASEIGQNTIAAFAADGQPRYLPGEEAAAAAAPTALEGDAVAGEKLALLHCGRCHVVGPKNRFGGIGSTPSFAALRTIPGWEDRFLAFWSENPHPAFTQVEGVTEPFDPARPPHIAPVLVTEEDVEAIAAYAATLKPKDLGGEIQPR